MITEKELLEHVAGLDATELSAWVEQGWVIPVRREGQHTYREIDVARVRLIVEIRREMHVGDDALPLVLSLVDQVYGLRRELKTLAEAVDVQPPEIRGPIMARLKRLRSA